MRRKVLENGLRDKWGSPCEDGLALRAGESVEIAVFKISAAEAACSLCCSQKWT